MKFCPMCGEKIPSASARFCNGCGLNLGEYRKKLERLAATAADGNKPSQKINVVRPSKKSADPTARPVATPKKNPPLQSVAATVGTLSADELFERGFSAELSELYSEAVRYYEKAAQAGHAEAMFRLGRCYLLGQGVEKDCPKCLEWYLKSAEAGYTTAMVLAGRVYDKYSTNTQASDFGVTKDDERAKKLFELAGQRGNLFGMADLGQFHFGEENYPAAFALWTSATDLGITSLLGAVGDMYFIVGDDNPKYFAKGLQCYFRERNEDYKRKNIGYLFNQNDAKDKAFNHEKKAFEFHVGNYRLTFKADYLEELVEIMSTLRPKINESLAKFTKFYTGKGNIDEVVPKAYGYGFSLLENFAGEGIRLLSKLNVQNRFTAENLVEKHFSYAVEIPAEIWANGTRQIKSAYQEIVAAAQSERDRRQARKDNRARWHGSGYDMSSAINAEIKAGMMNMTEGAAHSVWNFFGNMSTDAAEASNKEELYKSSKTLMTYCYHLSEAIRLIQDRILILAGFKEYLNKIEASQSIVENVRKGHVAQDKVDESIADALLAHPFNLEAYALYLSKFGDPYCRIRHLATAVGLNNEVEAVKKNIFVECVDKRLKSLKLFPKSSLSDMNVYAPNIKLDRLPSYEELKADYEVIESEALNLNINLYDNDPISYTACCYRLMIRAFKSAENFKDDGKTIPPFKYLNREDLGDVVVPEGVETIGAFAFAGAKLNSIKLPSTLKKIETGAFFDSFISTKLIDIPDGTEEISIDMLWDAFYSFVRLPNSILRITGEPEGFAFYNFKKHHHPNTKFFFDINRAEMLKDYFSRNDLMNFTNIFTVEKLLANSSKETLYIENEILFGGVLSDKDACQKVFDGQPFGVNMKGEFYSLPNSFVGFRGFASSRVKKVSWAPHLKIICDEAFFDCQDLETLTLPRSLEKLGARVFRACKNLKYVVIPETVKEIGDDLLMDCPAVIYCDANSFAAEYCRKNNLSMEDYGLAKLQEGRQILASSRNRGDFELAKKCFEESAYVGNAEGCYESGKCRLLEKWYEYAVEYFKRAAEAGHQGAMVELYKIYKTGTTDAKIRENIAQDIDTAVKWLQRSGYDAEEFKQPTLQKITNYVERIQFTEKLYERFQSVSCLYFSDSGSKAKEKIDKAIEAYARDEKRDNVICVFDDTFFGGADDGFLVTAQKIYGHNAYSKEIIVVPFANIKSFAVDGGNLTINGHIKISVAKGGKSAAENLPVMLNELKRALVG